MGVLLARVSILSILAILAASAAARAQTAPPDQSPPSAELLRQMRQELEALRAEEARAKAAEQDRARRIEALAQQLGATPSGPSPAPPPVKVTINKSSNSVATFAAATNTAASAVEANKPTPKSSILDDFQVKIFGKATLDAIYNTSRPQAPGNPVFLVPKFAGGFSQHSMDINARNSQVGLAFTGPMIWGLHSGGRISAVFFDNTNLFADRNGFLLTQSYGELFNDAWRFAAGLQLDVVAPGVPTVLPFAIDGAPIGNNIKGQVRVEHFIPLGSGSQLKLQLAIAEPLTTAKTPDISLDEDNGVPNLEARVALGWGKPVPVGIGLVTQRPLEFALSGMVGQLRRTSLPSEPPRRVISDVWLAAVDYQVNLASFFGIKGGQSGFFGFKGEAYIGQGLGNYGGGVLQSLDAVTWKAIRTSGGWVEGFVYLAPDLHNHTGIFIDDPIDDDISVIPNTLFGRTYNSTLYNTLIWDVSKAYRIALEATWRKTDYKDPTGTGRLPNEGFGLHTQFQWAFDKDL